MTAKRILVPLDGDERSEAIVPVVAAVARDSGAMVRLLRVYPVPERREGPHGRTIEYVDQAMSRLTAEAQDEFARDEARLAGVPVETVVRFGTPADEIALAEPAGGRLRDLLARGVAKRLARKTSVPTLVLRPAAA